ncbi:MAG: hypothetical protein WCP97_03555 [bacterium]
MIRSVVWSPSNRKDAPWTLYVLILLTLAVVQYFFLRYLQGIPVNLVFFLLMISFLFLTGVFSYVLLLLVKRLGLIKADVIQGDAILFGIHASTGLFLLLFLGVLCWQIPFLRENVLTYYSLRVSETDLANPQNFQSYMGSAQSLLSYFYIVLGVAAINFFLSNFLFRVNKVVAYCIASTSLISLFFILLVLFSLFKISHVI